MGLAALAFTGHLTYTCDAAAAQVLSSGVAPQSIAGFTLFNVTVPADAPSGSAVPLVVTVGGVGSPFSVTLTIKLSNRFVHSPLHRRHWQALGYFSLAVLESWRENVFRLPSATTS